MWLIIKGTIPRVPSFSLFVKIAVQFLQDEGVAYQELPQRLIESIASQVIQAVTFLSSSWKSFNLWKGHLAIQKKVTENCQE